MLVSLSGLFDPKNRNTCHKSSSWYLYINTTTGKKYADGLVSLAESRAPDEIMALADTSTAALWTSVQRIQPNRTQTAGPENICC